MKSITLFTLIVIVGIVGSCGKASTAESRAEVLPAPLPGYTCFLIRDENGKAVGGNCLATQ